MRKTTLLCLALLCLALPALAGVPETEPDNTVRIYGSVSQNVKFSNGDGFLIISVSSAGDVFRFDYLEKDNSGAGQLTAGFWVAIDGYLDSVVGCLDGPTTVPRPLVIYRWPVNEGWEVWDHDCSCWLPWP